VQAARARSNKGRNSFFIESIFEGVKVEIKTVRFTRAGVFLRFPREWSFSNLLLSAAAYDVPNNEFFSAAAKYKTNTSPFPRESPAAALLAELIHHSLGNL
jgi:hypothetical protein